MGKLKGAGSWLSLLNLIAIALAHKKSSDFQFRFLLFNGIRKVMSHDNPIRCDSLLIGF
jgi:hypothetical protein